MKKIVIFGLGRLESIIENYINFDSVEVKAFCDNKEAYWDKKRLLKVKGEFIYIPIISPKSIGLYDSEIDYVLIVAAQGDIIRNQILREGIEEKKILCIDSISATKEDLKLRNILLDNFFECGETYVIEGRKIHLSSASKFPEYKKAAPMYNSFFKFLAKIENEMISEGKKYVIDIGANVGDTIAAMIDYTESLFLAIEPNEEYMELMKANLSFSLKEFSDRICLEKAFIAENEAEKYELISHEGTGVKRSVEKSDTQTHTIPSLLKKHSIEMQQVSLIKVDTDGFDADCILSLKDLQKYSPLLYWENQIDNMEQYRQYIKMLDYICDCRYEIFFVFDNYGNYMGKMDVNAVKDLCGYLSRINAMYTPKTFYYIDVLACKKSLEALCEKYIEQYSAEYPLDRMC